MPHRPLIRLAFALATVAPLACTPPSAPGRCATDAECPANARCRAAVCATNTPPVARLFVPASPVTFALEALSGAESFDADPEDAIVAYHWSVRSTGAACEPPAVAGTTASASIRFGCAGPYEVALEVEDGFGARSLPAVTTVEVQEDSGVPLVTAGADVSAAHLCNGSPLRCHPLVAGGTISLASTGPVGAGITYLWTVQPPPDRLLGLGRRVTFLPGPDAPDPTVRIETDGLGISGDWIFRVEARDSAGAVGAATQRVSLANLSPEIASTDGPAPHRYDSVVRAYVAGREIYLNVVDPDGDPLEPREVTFHHTGDGPSATFTGTDEGDRLTYAIVVPDDRPDAAARLIGGPGLERSVQLRVSDVNGGQAVATWDVRVSNAAPVLAGPVAPVSVNHAYSGGAYRAEATLSTWVDPDGDPLALLDATGAPPCVLALRDGAVVASCVSAFTGTPGAGAIAGLRPLPHAVRDPWAEGDAVQVSLTVLNRAPTVTRVAFTAVGACGLTGACCEQDPDTEVCVAWEDTWGPGSVNAGFVADPDGDPLLVAVTSPDVTITPGSSICEPAACTFTFTPPQLAACGIPKGHLQATVSDGAAAASSPMMVTRACG